MPDYPRHAALSAAVGDHPVLLRSLDGDALLVNSYILHRLHLDQALDMPPRIPGGKIVLDEDLVPTGVFLGNARKRVLELLPEDDSDVIERRLLNAQEQLLALGLTCVHDMGVSEQTLEAYLELRKHGLLKLRIVAYLEGNNGFGAKELERFPLAPDGGDLLCVPGVHFTLDGSLNSRGAAMLTGYSDAPTEIGRLRLSEEDLTLLVHEAWQAGLQPAIAARGDRANRAALDTIERMKQVDESFLELRPRIEHAQVISPRDIPRFPELGITVAMQPSLSVHKPGFLMKRLGGHRYEGACLWRSLAPGWLKLAFCSNFPATDANPLLGFHAVLNRQRGELLNSDKSMGVKRQSGLDVLGVYTRGAAYAAHQEDRRGQLLPGYWADLTVLDVDPMEDNPDELLAGHALMTMINGRVVYRRAASPAAEAESPAPGASQVAGTTQPESSVASKQE